MPPTVNDVCVILVVQRLGMVVSKYPVLSSRMLSLVAFGRCLTAASIASEYVSRKFCSVVYICADGYIATHFRGNFCPLQGSAGNISCSH